VETRQKNRLNSGSSMFQSQTRVCDRVERNWVQDVWGQSGERRTEAWRKQ